MGCPIDLVCDKQAGCAMMNAPWRLRQVLGAMHAPLSKRHLPLTLKLRTGYTDDRPTATPLLADLRDMPVALYTLHGRSRCAFLRSIGSLCCSSH